MKRLLVLAASLSIATAITLPPAQNNNRSNIATTVPTAQNANRTVKTTVAPWPKMMSAEIDVNNEAPEAPHTPIVSETMGVWEKTTELPGKTTSELKATFSRKDSFVWNDKTTVGKNTTDIKVTPTNPSAFSIEEFRNPGMDYRAKPFWSLNDSLSKDEMRRQLEMFKEAGYGGAFLHSRIGLLTPYLSDEWFDLMDAGVQYCSELGLEAWFYDEDKWPSGFAGGIVPRMSDSYRSHTMLRIPVSAIQKMEADANKKIEAQQKAAANQVREKTNQTLAATGADKPANQVKAKTNKTLAAIGADKPANQAGTSRTRAIKETAMAEESAIETGQAESQPAATDSWLNPEDRILYRDDKYVYVDFLDRMGQAWYNGTCWVDLMNPEMVRAFIDCSYEPYIRRYSKITPAKGIFSDEPQVSPKPGDYPGTDAVLPYSPWMEKPFREMWGYDLDPALPSLLDTVGNWRTVRLHYYRTVAHCFETAFSSQIGQYCASHGFTWCGHFNGEEMASANMKNEGDLQQQLRNMNMPGVDALGLKYKNNHNDKVMTSTANQYGQKRRLIEIFGISGHNLSFEDRMWITAWHTNMGANFMCPHLSLYSAKGERKRDFPPTFSYHQPYFSENRLFEDFSARLCYFATAGKTVAEACVLSTLESDYILNGPNPIKWGMNTYDQTEAIINTALKRHVNIDIADEGFIQEIGSVSGGRFVIGEMAYSTVIVPQLYTIRPTTVAKLLEFGKQGGRIIVIGSYPRYVEGATNPEAIAKLRSCSILVADCNGALMAALPESEGLSISGPGADKIMTHLRDIDGGSSAQISNTSKSETVRIKVGFRNVPKGNVVRLLDPVSGRILSVPQTPFELELAQAQSYVLLSCSKAQAGKADATYSLPKPMETVVTLPATMTGKRLGVNSLPLDFAQFSTDGGRSWSDEEPVLAFYKRSANQPYDGPLMLRYSFNVGSVPESSAIAIEQPWIYDSIEVNGTRLDGWSHDNWFIDKNFRSHDVSSLVHEGRNTVTLSLNYASPQTTSSDARKRYGTEIETIYFTGDFAVEGTPAAEQPTTTWRNEFPRLEKKPLPTRFDKASLRIVADENSTFCGNLTTAGYPFYCGKFELDCEVEMPVTAKLPGKAVVKSASTAAGEKSRTAGNGADSETGKTTLVAPRYWLCFDKQEAILVKVTVNGTEFPTLCCAPWRVDVTEALKPGRNDIRIVLTGSLRNVFGPYHNIGGEFNAVGPANFSGDADWPNVKPGDRDWYDKRKTGTAALWRDDYYCIPFGLLEAPRIMVEKK